MNNYESNKLFADLILNLNAIPTNKPFRRIRARYLIWSAKKKIKQEVRKNQYNGYDIYRFLLFIDSADKLRLFDKPTNVEYSCYKSNETTPISSGVLKVVISYDSNHTLEVCFKPVVELDKSKIDMGWTICDKESTIVDYKDVFSRSKFYSTSTEILVDKVINPTEPISETKVLEWSSADILYQTFIICIESVFKRIEMRYLNEKA